MVPIRHWRMVLGNITPKASDRDVEVQKVAPRFKRDAQNQPIEELEGYNLSFLALKGCDQICKLPLSAKKEVEDIQKLLADGQAIVRVKFINAVLKAYALKSNTTGELLTGISMSADSLEVTSVEKPEVEDVLIDFQ